MIYGNTYECPAEDCKDIYKFITYVRGKIDES